MKRRTLDSRERSDAIALVSTTGDFMDERGDAALTAKRRKARLAKKRTGSR
jgi:hypothetical protein